MFFLGETVLFTAAIEDTGVISSRETDSNATEGKHDTSTLHDSPDDK